VVSHRTRISMKLDAHNSAELTRSAIRMGLVEP
jgi:DNA-binding NarL/FixJ family response regulator